MNSLFGSMQAPSSSISRGMRSLLFGLMVIESGCDGTPSDVVASKSMRLSRWAELSPYVGVASYLARSHEKADAVNLDDENVGGVFATAGLATQP